MGGLALPGVNILDSAANYYILKVWFWKRSPIYEKDVPDHKEPTGKLSSEPYTSTRYRMPNSEAEVESNGVSLRELAFLVFLMVLSCIAIA